MTSLTGLLSCTSFPQCKSHSLCLYPRDNLQVQEWQRSFASVLRILMRKSLFLCPLDSILVSKSPAMWILTLFPSQTYSLHYSLRTYILLIMCQLLPSSEGQSGLWPSLPWQQVETSVFDTILKYQADYPSAGIYIFLLPFHQACIEYLVPVKQCSRNQWLEKDKERIWSLLSSSSQSSVDNPLTWIC